MLQSSGALSAASFVALPPSGTPNAVSTTPLAGFPTAGPSYTIMTSGDATLADQPNDSGSSGVGLGGANVRGNTDYDVSILKIDLNVPVGINCLSFDFRFLSDEFPEFVGSSVNDGFVAELDNSTWTTVDSVINAPNNFAFDPSGDVNQHQLEWRDQHDCRERHGHDVRRSDAAPRGVDTDHARCALALSLDLRSGRRHIRLGRLPRQPRPRDDRGRVVQGRCDRTFRGKDGRQPDHGSRRVERIHNYDQQPDYFADSRRLDLRCAAVRVLLHAGLHDRRDDG